MISDCDFTNGSSPKKPKMNGKENAPPLTFKVRAECPVSKARTGLMQLIHHHVDTPVFMPVGTQVKNKHRYFRFYNFR